MAFATRWRSASIAARRSPSGSAVLTMRRRRGWWGASVDLGLGQGVHDAMLALKALGGAAPLTWFVNGAPIGEPDMRRESIWRPDGAGFARVSVVDAKGATDSIVVRLQ